MDNLNPSQTSIPSVPTPKKYKGLKIFFFVLCVLIFLVSCFLSNWVGNSFRDLFQSWSFIQIIFLSFTLGVYLILIKNKQGLPGKYYILLVLILPFAVSYFMANFVHAGLKKISELPTDIKYVQDQPYTYKQHQVSWGWNKDTKAASLTIYLKDLSSGEIHTIENASEIRGVVYQTAAVALGEDFAVWISQTPDADTTYQTGAKPVFSVWKYDFKTKREILLSDHINNNANPNCPSLAVVDREAIIFTFANKLTTIDVDNKTLEEIPMLSGYNIGGNQLMTFKQNDKLKRKVVFPASSVENGWFADKLFSYDIVDKNFDTIYKPQQFRYFTTIKSSDEGKIYWIERKEWAPNIYYMYTF